ncbi:MAG: HD domain-containing protein [Rhodocyclales bacterium]|nr:HD domain-containing protein [Rhodocyclales bacterium]
MFEIHRIVIRRVLLAWMAISLIALGLTYWVESQRTEEALLAVADARAQELDADELLPNALSSPTADPLQQRLENRLLQHFLRIEVFDRAGKRLAVVANPAYSAQQNELETALQTLPRDLLRHVHRRELGEHTLIEASFPVKARPGFPAGHIAAAFILDPTLKQILVRGLERTLWLVLLVILATTLALYPLIIRLNRSVLRASTQILQGNLETAAVLSAAIALRDSETGEHNYRVTLYAMDLAEAIQLDASSMRGLILGALLHDVGKIGIPDHILHKPGPLSPEETELMRQHVAHGVGIIGASKWLRKARDVIEYHHEKYDGSGYLKGLRGEEIPLIARIFAIVDVFDALASRRPYKASQPIAEVKQQLLAGAGSHFDPHIVRIFVNLAEQSAAPIQSASHEALLNEFQRRATPYFLALNAPGNRH